jgi:hypothetical protein
MMQMIRLMALPMIASEFRVGRKYPACVCICQLQFEGISTVTAYIAVAVLVTDTEIRERLWSALY